MPQTDGAPTDRTRVRRKADRGRYGMATITSILDEALLCHVGFAVEGRPWVMPMAFSRIDERLYLHGASGNAALKSLAAGVEACITFTLLDGLVLSRSAFHHSMNYRSAMVRLPIAECSAKVRTGGPIEDPDDLGLAHWAGELPLRTVAQAPIPDGAGPVAVPSVPTYLQGFHVGDRRNSG
jgi:hypothetical protein